MKLRRKIILFSIIPLLLAFCAISLTVYYQGNSLAKQERNVIESTYRTTKDSELKNYVEIARLAISQMYESGNSDADKHAAKAILERLEYSVDGYYFVYDYEGRMIVHPKQKEKVGTIMIDETDDNGKPLVRNLIDIAKKGGGFYDYSYRKFSTPKLDIKPKRAYVVGLPEWGWMLGTGVYMDDIDAVLAKADKKASNNIINTMLWILVITILSLLMINSLGLALNIWDQRDTLEKTRKKIAFELHAGVCQKLGSVKLNIEAAMLRFTNSDQDSQSMRAMLGDMAKRIANANVEIQSIAHELYEKILTEFGLETALRQFEDDYPDAPIQFFSEGEVDNLPIYLQWALYRVGQVAVDNVQKHAEASNITLHLKGDKRYVTLEISDDGIGFDVNKCISENTPSLGLLSIREKIEDEKIDGQLTIDSSSAGTTITARVPRKPRNIFWITFFPWIHN